MSCERVLPRHLQGGGVGISVAGVIVLKRPFIDFLLAPPSKMKIARWLRDGGPRRRFIIDQGQTGKGWRGDLRDWCRWSR